MPCSSISPGATISDCADDAAAAAAARAGGRGWVVGSERIDVPDLCAYFLGRRGQLVYVASICLYIYSSLWAYAVLVAQTLSVALPLQPPAAEGGGGLPELFSYWVYLAGFGLVGGALALRDITGPFMTGLNLAFSYARCLMALLMVGTLAHALSVFWFAPGGGGADGDDDTSLFARAPAPLCAPSGLAQMLPTGAKPRDATRLALPPGEYTYSSSL